MFCSLLGLVKGIKAVFLFAFYAGSSLSGTREDEVRVCLGQTEPDASLLLPHTYTHSCDSFSSRLMLEVTVHGRWDPDVQQEGVCVDKHLRDQTHHH